MNKAAFYNTVRNRLGKLRVDQVEGFEVVLATIAGQPLAFQAYMLATTWWETAATMEPVREAFNLSEAWRKRNFRYYPHYGRGYVQLTWEGNYVKADGELAAAGLIKKGELIANPDKAMEPKLAAFILLRGMLEGWFSGDKKGRHTLARHLPSSGVATREQYIAARRIINIQDKADEIEDVAQVFERALRDAGVK